jgi:hypothetical protein
LSSLLGGKIGDDNPKTDMDAELADAGSAGMMQRFWRRMIVGKAALLDRATPKVRDPVFPIRALSV